MGIRKAVSAFLASTVFVLLLSLLFPLFGKGGSIGEILHRIGNSYMIYGMYVFPVVLLYGTLASLAAEWITRRSSGMRRIAFSGTVHLALGALFGVFTNIGFSLFGLIGSGLFFLTDEWLRACVQHTRYWERIRNTSMVAPFVLGAVALGLIWGFEPRPQPIDMQQAVRMAVEPEGTVNAMFPDTIGEKRGVIEGYQVTRTTTAVKIAEGTYRVTFTERWEKGSERGENRMHYLVEAGSVGADGGEGPKPPYKRISF